MMKYAEELKLNNEVKERLVEVGLDLENLIDILPETGLDGETEIVEIRKPGEYYEIKLLNGNAIKMAFIRERLLSISLGEEKKYLCIKSKDGKFRISELEISTDGYEAEVWIVSQNVRLVINTPGYRMSLLLAWSSRGIKAKKFKVEDFYEFVDGLATYSFESGFSYINGLISDFKQRLKDKYHINFNNKDVSLVVDLFEKKEYVSRFEVKVNGDTIRDVTYTHGKYIDLRTRRIRPVLKFVVTDYEKRTVEIEHYHFGKLIIPDSSAECQLELTLEMFPGMKKSLKEEEKLVLKNILLREFESTSDFVKMFLQ